MLELDQLKRSTFARFYTRGKQLYEQGHVRSLGGSEAPDRAAERPLSM